jgi:MATE family multidrug resistance protein
MSNSDGGFKKLALLFLPICLMTFSNSVFLFIEKVFLGSLSSEAMEVAVNAAYTCQIFQAPCVALAMMLQVFVARWKGANELKSIGPGVWQFVWFSFLSMAITLPIGYLYGHFYFKGTGIEEIVFPYYYFLLSINFIYPLGATLSCFFIGLGKTRLVLWTSVASQIVKIILAYLLIFGFFNMGIPSFGILGGVTSTLIAQGGFIIALFCVFLNEKHENLFNTRSWKFHLSLFLECMHPGLLRALNRILNFTNWAAIMHLMIAKGGDYLLMLSIGGALFVFLPFLGDAICQAQTTVVSQILGAKNYSALKKAFTSGTILTIVTISFLALPLIVFPLQTFDYLFPKIALTEQSIRLMFLGIWFSFSFMTWAFIPISYILAFKDMKFSLFMGVIGWVNGYFFMYFAMNAFNFPSDFFWLILSIMHGGNALFYYLRMKTLESRLGLKEFVPSR